MQEKTITFKVIEDEDLKLASTYYQVQEYIDGKLVEVHPWTQGTCFSLECDLSEFLAEVVYRAYPERGIKE